MTNTKLNLFVSFFIDVTSMRFITLAWEQCANEAAVANFKVLHGRTYESHETLQSR
jgi:hypothetical protein